MDVIIEIIYNSLIYKSNNIHQGYCIGGFIGDGLTWSVMSKHRRYTTSIYHMSSNNM